MFHKIYTKGEMMLFVTVYLVMWQVRLFRDSTILSAINSNQDQWQVRNRKIRFWKIFELHVIKILSSSLPNNLSLC
jgi:hypothetical protein